MYQKIVLVGHVGRDPELKTIKDGLTITSFTLAVDCREKGQKTTMWSQITAFGQTANFISQYVQKGSLVLVEGRLNPDAGTGGPKVYQRKDGTYGASYEITADKLELLSKSENKLPNPDPIDPDDIPF